MEPWNAGENYERSKEREKTGQSKLPHVKKYVEETARLILAEDCRHRAGGDCFLPMIGSGAFRVCRRGSGRAFRVFNLLTSWSFMIQHLGQSTGETVLLYDQR